MEGEYLGIWVLWSSWCGDTGSWKETRAAVWLTNVAGVVISTTMGVAEALEVHYWEELTSTPLGTANGFTVSHVGLGGWGLGWGVLTGPHGPWVAYVGPDGPWVQSQGLLVGS